MRETDVTHSEGGVRVGAEGGLARLFFFAAHAPRLWEEKRENDELGFWDGWKKT